MSDIVFTSCFGYNERRMSEPMGISFLKSALEKRGIKGVAIIEPSIYGDSIEIVAQKIANLQPKILGLSILLEKHIDNATMLVKLIRKYGCDPFIFVGGHAFSLSSKDKIGLLSNIDCGLIGESDNIIYDFIYAVINKKSWQNMPGVIYFSEGKLIANEPVCKISNLDEIPFMDRSVLAEYIKLYGKGVEASILTSRGCAYSRCTYCTVKPYEDLQIGCFYRQRSIENIVEEIKYLYYTYGISRFNFEDDNFILPNKNGRKRLLLFCDLLEKLPFNIEYTFFCRVDSIDVELFKKLIRVGLRSIYLGIESFYDYTLDYFEKGIKFRDLECAFKKLEELGFSASINSQYRIHVGFITWHPNVTIAELQHNLLYIDKYKLPIKVFTRKLALYSGSKLFEDYKSIKVLKNEYDWDYKDKKIAVLEKYIIDCINFFMLKRDQLRTIEKFSIKNNCINNKDLSMIISDIDKLCYDYIFEILHSCEYDKIRNKYHVLYDNLIKEYDVDKIIEIEYNKLNLDKNNNNLFRK